MNLPTDIGNQALDAVAADFVMGDLEEGTKPAQIILRAYGQCLRQLLRAAHWNMARKQTPLVLLGDATGQTPNVSSVVQVPWCYSYAWPTDCMKMRFVPYNYPANPGAPAGNIVPANSAAPLSTGLGQQPMTGARLRPARWLEGTDFNYPVPAGQISWETQGVSPQGRTVILTNVQFAMGVYTALMLYPSNWDALFRAAMVAYLASEIALAIWVNKDRKFGLELRTQQIALAKEKITQARATDGDEGFFRNDNIPDWLRDRDTGAGRGYWGGGGGFAGGPGVLFGGWDACSFSDGTAY